MIPPSPWLLAPDPRWDCRVKLLLAQRRDRHLGQCRRGGWFGHGINERGRDNYEQFGVERIHRPGPKQLPQDGYVADTRHLVELRSRSLIQQSGDAKALAVS